MSPDGPCVIRDPGLSPSVGSASGCGCGKPRCHQDGGSGCGAWKAAGSVCPYENGGNGAKETLSVASPLRDDPEMLNEI